MTGQVLGDIYLGKIKNWNDSAIGALNPGMALPDQRIVVNFRRDGSGTTYTFTDYLAKASAQWAKQVGAGMVVQWPAGLPTDGNEGVAEAVKVQPGAIGYVELSYAFAKNLPYAQLQNRAGAWVDANQLSINAAAESLADGMPQDLQQSITGAPGPSAYPIASYSYLLFCKQQHDPAKVSSFSRFVTWILHDGQSYAAPLHYAPLPEQVANPSDLQLKEIAVSGYRGVGGIVQHEPRFSHRCPQPGREARFRHHRLPFLGLSASVLGSDKQWFYATMQPGSKAERLGTLPPMLRR